MSLKVCLNILPALTNTVIAHNKCIYHVNKTLVRQICLYTNCATDHKTSISYSTKKIKSINKTPKRNPLKIVYRGLLTPQIKAVKVFSLSSSIVGIIAQPFLYKEIAATGNIPIIIAAYSFIGFFTFVTPVLLHLITKKYVTELCYNSETDSYIAKTVNFLCMIKETEFKTDDVKVPDVPGMFTTLYANGKPLFLDPRSFGNPEHYAKLMGYDKPIDFKLYDNCTESPEKKN